MSSYDAYDCSYCFACSRPTDHVGEHDGLVAAGLVEYQHGDVVRTALWNADLAASVSDAEYMFVYGENENTSVVSLRKRMVDLIDANNECIGRPEHDLIDWTPVEQLFHQGLSLVLGEPVVGLAARRAEQAAQHQQVALSRTGLI